LLHPTHPAAGHKNDIQFSDMPKSRRPKTKPQENYVPQASSASATTTKLLQKRRKNNEWQQLLELKREEFAKRMAECDARQAELKKKCKDLRKRVQTKEQEVTAAKSLELYCNPNCVCLLNKPVHPQTVLNYKLPFPPHDPTYSSQVQETRSKIDRATKKQQEEKGFQEQKDEEIKEKRTTVTQEEVEYEELIKKLERTNKFKQYLDMVCEQNEGYFEDVDAITHRYDSLSATEALSKAKEEASGELIKSERDILAKFSKRATTEVVEKNAQMAQMRTSLDNLRSHLKDQSAEALKRMDEQQKRVKDLGSIHMAVDNLYNRCFVLGKEKQNKATLQEIDRIKGMAEKERIENMLTRLSTYYEDIHAISKDAKDHPKKPEQNYSRPIKTEKKKGEKKKSAGEDKGVAKADTGSSVANTEFKGGEERRSSVPSKERRNSQISASARSNQGASESRPQSGHSVK